MPTMLLLSLSHNSYFAVLEQLGHHLAHLVDQACYSVPNYDQSTSNLGTSDTLGEEKGIYA